MRTDPSVRTRYPSTFVARARAALAGLLGGDPGLGRDVQVQAITAQQAAYGDPLYTFSQGDVFLPGTGNFVFNPVWETQLMTVWGHGFQVRANAFAPFKESYLSHPNLKPVGVGGQISGQWITQPLTIDDTGTPHP